MLRELVRYRHLLFVLIWRDIRVRYKQTVMGFFWALLMPAFVVVAGVLVKKTFAVAQGGALDATSVASIAVKALPWAFFVGSIRFATTSLTSNASLLTKIYFPREVLPVAAVLANLVDSAVSSLVLVTLLAWLGLSISMQLLWVPVLVVMLILLTIGFSLVLSCANLFFRDVKYLVEVGLTFAIFFTPVFYDARMLGEWAPFVLANPVGAILEALNDVVVRQATPDLFWLAYAALWAGPGCALASVLFDQAEPMLAERV